MVAYSCRLVSLLPFLSQYWMLFTAPKLHRMTQDDAADKAAKAAVA